MTLKSQRKTAGWIFSILVASCISWGGAPYTGPKEVVKNPIEDPWADVIRPISNPTLFDLAIPQTLFHPIFVYNEMPTTVDTILGQVPVGGSYQVYALQVEVALNERLSINATKDGYIDFNADNVLSRTSGWANVGAGVKYAWAYKPEEKFASNVQLLYEILMGNRDVWQGEGDGIFIPSIATLKLCGPWQFSNQLGFKLPVDGNSDSTMFYTSAHVSYELNEWIKPLAEINWFHVLYAGDGARRFPAHIGEALPAVVGFEGGDLVSWGASNATMNRDLVTAAVGFRVTPPSRPYDFGFG